MSDDAPRLDFEEAFQREMQHLPADPEECERALEQSAEALNRCHLRLIAEHRKLMQDQLKAQIPDTEILGGITDRMNLSNQFGVSEEDFDVVYDEIKDNETALHQLRRLTAIGAEMTIISVTDAEIVFIDTVEIVHCIEQKKFLEEADTHERAEAVRTLEHTFPEIVNFLEKAHGENGVSYYEFLVLCQLTGAKPLPENEYRALQQHKIVDTRFVCWLLTQQKNLDEGDAKSAYYEHECTVGVSDANNRTYRGGRFRLTISRTAPSVSGTVSVSA